MKKLTTKILSLTLMLSMIFSLGTTAFAAGTVIPETKVSGTVTVDELIEHLNSVDFGRNITFTALPQSRTNEQELLKFDSVEDAEIYIKQFMDKSRELTMPTETFGQNNVQPQFNAATLAKKNSGWYTSTVWWWGGGNTSLLSLTNAEIKYYYSNSGGGKVSNITVNNSYMTGIVGATWTHRRGTGTALGGMDTKYSVTGTWFIGLDIWGFPIGASFDETLKSPKITLNME
ncbi:hypothetical protein [Anaerotignum sp.]|uniref:hypothetical protein n=1 Tax=Anaerotignum sp. TaxID=2039241 RepID=UPI0028B1371E|nr:hypothetical protein [Anaerotignum sp.]